MERCTRRTLVVVLLVLFAATAAACSSRSARTKSAGHPKNLEGVSTWDPLTGTDYVPPIGHEAPLTGMYSMVDGHSRSTTVDGTMFAEGPDWSPESSSPPPISIQQAVRTSREVLKLEVKHPEAWGLVQVALERTNRYWCYIVRWRPTVGTKDFFQIPVLLSGR